MKAIGIIGYKKSGKTTLTMALAESLIKKGHSVAIIKHSSNNIDYGNTDTGLFMEKASTVALITPDNSEIIFKGQYKLKDIISHLSEDILLIEGFKSLKYFPKILCVRNANDKKELEDDLTLFTAGMDNSLKKNKIANYLITDESDIDYMSKQIEENGFLLPDMNCGDCGYKDCYGLARAIMQGKESLEKCEYSFEENFLIQVNKRKIHLNPFMSKLYQSILHGMLSPLKDIDSLKNGLIEIKWNPTDNFNKKNN